jgi:hypothetical protein
MLPGIRKKVVSDDGWSWTCRPAGPGGCAINWPLDLSIVATRIRHLWREDEPRDLIVRKKSGVMLAHGEPPRPMRSRR